MITVANENERRNIAAKPPHKGQIMNRMTRNSRFASLMALSLAASCFAEAAGTENAENTAGTDAPTAEAPQKVGQAAKKAIINGRMPVAVVAQIRFGNDKGEATKVLADKYGTTVGKIDDIKKNRNFAYVTADFKPTAAQKQQGIDWLKSHPYYDAAGVDKLITELDATPEASAEEAAAFEAVRVQARGQQPTTKEGEVADAGGGNRRKPRAKKTDGEAKPAADAAATGDALLA